MLVHGIVVQQAPRTAAPSNQNTSERHERPGASDRVSADGPPTREQVRAQIRENMQAVNDAMRDVERDARVRSGDLAVPPPGMPGHTTQPIFGDHVIPPQAVDIAMGFFVMCAVMVVGWPLARAFGRRMERGGQPAIANPAMSEQLERIEQAVDAMSIEVERISESQRFLAKLQNSQAVEHAALPGSERR